MNPQDVSFDHAWLRYPSLAETTVLRQVVSVQVRLRNDALMGAQMLLDLCSLQQGTGVCILGGGEPLILGSRLLRCGGQILLRGCIVLSISCISGHRFLAVWVKCDRRRLTGLIPVTDIEHDVAF